MSAAHAAAAKAPAFAIPAMQAMMPPQASARSGFVPPLASLAAIPAQPAVQRTCGGCAAGEKEELPVQPRLEVGPAGDHYEREADAIAGQVMAMRDSEVAAAAAPAVQRAFGDSEEESEESEVQPRLLAPSVGAAPAVQRACSACSASDDEPRARRAGNGGLPAAHDEDEESVRARHTGAGGGSETIQASHGDLTGGGAPLPPATQDYFETRMGRDLSDVRVHEGGGSRALNSSISARAFTYQNHIWLGGGESAGPSFTMAHELAHVMQQTAPGPIGPARRRETLRARPADAAIQRRGKPFWLPSGVEIGETLAQHTVMHNAALKAIRKENPQVISEVPIPGGNRRGVGAGQCGFADLYTAGGDTGTVMVPGIEEVATPPVGTAAASGTPAEPAAPTDPAAPIGPATTPQATPIASLNNFKLHESLTTCTERIGQAMQQGTGKSAPGLHESRRAPKIVGGRLTDIASAPGKIRIGEMKPAHDIDYRDKGVKQINNYIAGITATAAQVNKVALAMGENASWAPGATDIGGTLKLPVGWDAEGKITDKWKIKSIKIRFYAPTKRKVVKAGKVTTKRGFKAKDRRQGRPKSEPIRGRWKMAADPDRSGLFVYFLAPNPDDLAKAVATPSTRDDFRKLAAKIGKIQSELIVAPKPTVMPLRIDPRRGGPSVRRATPLAAAGRARVMRKEVKEGFNAADWEARRTGKGLAPGATDNSGLADYDATVPDDVREDIADQGAIAQWLKEKPPTPDVSYDKVKPDAKAESDLTLLKKVDFWTGPKAWPFGVLRGKFGAFFATAFKKVHDFGERMQAKFKEKKEADILGNGPKGTIMKAAAKVASVVFPRIAKPFLKTMYNTIIDCGVRGFEAKFRELTEGTVIEDVIALADEASAKVNDIKEDIESYFTRLIDDTIAPLKAGFDKWVEEAKLVAEVASMIAELAKAARIGSCIAGLVAAPETVGIGAVVGCGAALGDYILSKFGLSPVEYFIARTLQSCDTQNKIGAMLAAVDFIKSLPREAGKAVVKKVKSLLAGSNLPGTFGGKTTGVHASELFCNPDAMTFPDMAYERSNCSDTGHFKGSATDSYDIPDDIRLFEKGDRITRKERRWMGVETPKGATAKAPPAKSAQPTPPTEPAAPAQPADPVKPPVPAPGGDSAGETGGSKQTIKIVVTGKSFESETNVDVPVYLQAPINKRTTYNGEKVIGTVTIDYYGTSLTAPDKTFQIWSLAQYPGNKKVNAMPSEQITFEVEFDNPTEGKRTDRVGFSVGDKYLMIVQ